MQRTDSTNRFCARLMLLAGTAAPSLPVIAQDAVPAAELQRCAVIAGGAERLDCFDALTRDLSRTPQAPMPTPQSSAETAPASESDADAFGSELIENENADVPQEIQSRLIGEFTGWRGNTEFRLENGQVWRQVDQGRLIYNADSPLVTIRRGAFSSYRLRIEGLNRSVRVRRVQ